MVESAEKVQVYEDAVTSAGIAPLNCHLYAMAAEGAEFEEQLRAVCRHLAHALGLRLALICERAEHGTVAIKATSSENALWADLLRVPERWDGTVAGNGAAAVALREAKPAIVGIAQEGFLPWRRAAERERVRMSGAWPLRLGDREHVLEMFSESTDFGDAESLERIGRIVRKLQDVFAHLAQIRHERLLARALESAGSAAFLADLNGIIVWCNQSFCRLYGYSRDEVIGRNPRFLQSGRQGMRYYRNLWSTIRAGKIWSGETVDRDRNGNAHTVRQTISPVEVDGVITHYLAVQDNVTHAYDEQSRHELRMGMDERTQLLTRSAFERRVNRALEGSGAMATYVLVSMRKFHQALGTLEPQVEDATIAEIGKRIRKEIGGGQHAGALGAGEYGMLLEDVTSEAAAEHATALRNRLSAPYALGGEIPVSVRTALARAPDDGRTFIDLHRHADRQLATEPMQPARRKRFRV